jgi:hypothetical protein
MGIDFQAFWQSYPRKVGKLAAEKAYEKARKRGVTQQQLLDGIAAYVQHKPAYADFCHPATWLNQGRWDDEYAPATKTAGGTLVLVATTDGVDVYSSDDWWQECKTLHQGQCNGQAGHRVQMQLDAGRQKVKV